MLINYETNGQIVEVDVAPEVHAILVETSNYEKSNERAETCRHTTFDEFTYEDAKYFSNKTDLFEVVTSKIFM